MAEPQNPTPNQPDVDKILSTIREVESRNNYSEKSKNSTASGAYQFINDTWQRSTKRAGIGTEYKTAADAPPEVQDAVAAWAVKDILGKVGGDVTKVPLVWYTGNPQGTMTEEALRVNKGLKPDQYQQKWLAVFNRGQQAQPTATAQAPTTTVQASRTLTTAAPVAVGAKPSLTDMPPAYRMALAANYLADTESPETSVVERAMEMINEQQGGAGKNPMAGFTQALNDQSANPFQFVQQPEEERRKPVPRMPVRMAEGGEASANDIDAQLNQLYEQSLGRKADTGGFDYWKKEFGPDIDTAERLRFIEGAAPEVQQRLAAGDKTLPAYMQVNPEVRRALSSQDLTTDQYKTLSNYFGNQWIGGEAEDPASLTRRDYIERPRTGYDFATFLATRSQDHGAQADTQQRMANLMAPYIGPTGLSRSADNENQDRFVVNPITGQTQLASSLGVDNLYRSYFKQHHGTIGGEGNRFAVGMDYSIDPVTGQATYLGPFTQPYTDTGHKDWQGPLGILGTAAGMYFFPGMDIGSMLTRGAITAGTEVAKRTFADGGQVMGRERGSPPEGEIADERDRDLSDEDRREQLNRQMRLAERGLSYSMGPMDVRAIRKPEGYQARVSGSFNQIVPYMDFDPLTGTFRPTEVGVSYGQMGPEGGYQLKYGQPMARPGQPAAPAQLTGEYRQQMGRNAELQASGYYAPIPNARDAYGAQLRYTQRFADGGVVYREDGSPQVGEIAEQMTVGTVPREGESSADRISGQGLRALSEVARGVLGLDPIIPGSEAYRTGQALGNMPAVGAAAGTIRGIKNISKKDIETIAKELDKSTGKLAETTRKYPYIRDASVADLKDISKGEPFDVYRGISLLPDTPLRPEIMPSTTIDPKIAAEIIRGAPVIFTKNQVISPTPVLRRYRDIYPQEAQVYVPSMIREMSQRQPSSLELKIPTSIGERRTVADIFEEVGKEKEVLSDVSKKAYIDLIFNRYKGGFGDRELIKVAEDVLSGKWKGGKHFMNSMGTHWTDPNAKTKEYDDFAEYVKSYFLQKADGGEVDLAEQMTVGTLPQDQKPAGQVFKDIGRDVVRGAQYLPYDLLGAPVDIATMAMRPFGYNVEKPVGGSEWLIEKSRQAGIADQPTGSAAETATRIGMGFVNPAAVARQIPRGIAALEKGAETLGTGAVRAITGKPDITPEQIYQAMAEPKGILQLGAPATARPLGSAINTQPEVMKLRQAVREELDIVPLPKTFTSEEGRAFQESYYAAKEKYGPQMEAIEKTLVPKLENYFTRQYGTVNDPLYQATLEGKYMPRAFYSPNNTFRWDKTAVVETTGLQLTKDNKLTMEHVNKLKELSSQGNKKAQLILGKAYDLADRPEAFQTPISIAESLKNPQNFSYVVERLKAYNVKNPEDVIKTYVANAPKLKSPSADDNFNKLEAIALTKYDADTRKLLKEQAKDLSIPTVSSNSRMVSSVFPFKDLTEKTRQEIIRGKPMYQTMQTFGENIDYRDIVDYVLKAPLDKWQKMSVPELIIASHVNPANVTKPSKVARMADDGIELLPFQKIMGTAEYLPVKSKMLGDGAQWREITTKEGLRIEGGLMDHCLKKDSLGYCNRLLNKESKYFTLRDADGHPYVSIEMTKPMGQEKQDVPFNVIRQVKGYMNSKAVPAYGEEISDFLAAWENQIGVKLRPAENPDYLPEKFKPQQFGIQSPPENMAKGGMVDKPLYDRAA